MRNYLKSEFVCLDFQLFGDSKSSLPERLQCLPREVGCRWVVDGQGDGIEQHDSRNEITEKKIFSRPDIREGADEWVGGTPAGCTVEHLP